MVETRGFVAAIEAADAMCKAAQVRFTRCEITRDALVTIVVRGALAEVEASVAAGARSAGGVGELLRQHVIPAPEPRLEPVELIPGPAVAPTDHD